MALSGPRAEAQQNWPQFRGLGGTSAIGPQRDLPQKWSSTENVAWKADIPGLGWSSPIVWGKRVFLTTVVDLANQTDAPKKGMYLGGERREPPAGPHQWIVLCLDLETGEKLWEQVAHEGVPEFPHHVKNSYASETPVTDGRRVHALFGNVGIFCFDLDGKPLWQHKLPTQKTANLWGTGASPVLHEERLYYVFDNEDESYLLALDTATGDTAFRITRDESSNWATPLVWTNSQRTELITAGKNRMRSYDLDGQLLWDMQTSARAAVPTPIAEGDLLYLAAGHLLGKNKPVFAIRAGASGDISDQVEEASGESIVWSQPYAAPYNPSPLFYQGNLYVLLDTGFLSCFDGQTGEPLYGKQAKHRIPKGRSFTASPWGYDGKIFCLNEDGETFVIRAGEDFELLYSNPLEEDDMTLACPAIVGDRILIRTAGRLYCIQQSDSGVARTEEP
jgi:outer membrane protein assembly factor BamB